MLGRFLSDISILDIFNDACVLGRKAKVLQINSSREILVIAIIFYLRSFYGTRNNIRINQDPESFAVREY